MHIASLRTQFTRVIGVAVMAALLIACGGNVIKPKPTASTTHGQSDSRYTIKQDTGPATHKDMSNAPDAVPRVEPYSRGGNKSSYQVWGKNYHVMPSGIGFREEGVASWYGEKFHGHLTSNGETYDMYAMSAAHKHIPIPSYARVTNLDNGKMVIVRVNDRGPFHGNRIIDLSYAAASKLDYHKKGVARVLVEVIDASTWSAAYEQNLRRQRGASNYIAPVTTLSQTTIVSANSSTVPVTAAVAPMAGVINQGARLPGQYVQTGAFADIDKAEALAQKLREQLRRSDVRIERASNGQLFRVLIGPFSDGNSAMLISQQVIDLGYGKPLMI